jgi:hypothetical protein
MNRGAVAFKGLGVSSKIWEGRIGKKPVTIDSYKAGRRTPDAETREAIHEDWGGPHPDLWDELVTEAPSRTVREPVPVVPVTPEGTEGEAAKLLAHIRRLQDDLTNAAPEDHELAARVRMADQLAGAIAKLGQVSGTRVTERAILASPHWLEVEGVIVAALEPWPDAMRAVATALEGRRAGGAS